MNHVDASRMHVADDGACHMQMPSAATRHVVHNPYLQPYKDCVQALFSPVCFTPDQGPNSHNYTSMRYLKMPHVPSLC